MAASIEAFRDASPARQLAVVASVALVVLLALALAWYFLLRTVYEPVFSDLQPADASTIVAQLEKDKIPYRLDTGGTRVLVPDDQVNAARVKVMGSDLPFRGTVGLELFGKSDMGMTDFAQKINYQRALQGELARTIMAIDGVDSARVHLALGEDRVFRDDRIPPKASIMVKMRGDATIPASSVEGIRRLVSAAIDQLEPDNVVVLDEYGALLSAPVSTTEGGVGVSPEVAARQAAEGWYEARIRQAIEPVASANEIMVTVQAGPIQSAEKISAPRGSSRWNIAARNFSLAITLSPREPTSDQVLDQLRSLARQAVDYDTDKGDTIAIGVWSPVAGPASDANENSVSSRSRDAAAAAPTISEASGNMAMFAAAFLAAICLFVVGGLVIVGRSRRRADVMGDTERMAFADRLNMLLQEDARKHHHASN